MFHALALVKIKDGGAKHFFETFFEVTFIDGHFATEFLDGDGLTDMFEQNFAGPHDLFPILFVRQEFTSDIFHLLITQHTIKAIKQEHLRLRVDINIR